MTNDEPRWTLGIIGGSGLYTIEGLENPELLDVTTPWGPPSDRLCKGRIGDIDLVFLPRHGAGHRLPPSEVNARANIDALKQAGCTDVLAVSSVGSLREELSPGHFVVVDQIIDRTVNRVSSFFGTGMVAHVSMAQPVCPRLARYAGDAARETDADVADGVTYLAMEGPQFSTRAESMLYRQWNCDVIGMTAMPEAKLAREAELPYALIGMVTDYDCWRDDTAHVEVADVIRQMVANAERARCLIATLARLLPVRRASSPIDTCLDHALITDPSFFDPAMTERLKTIAGRAARARAGESGER